MQMRIDLEELIEGSNGQETMIFGETIIKSIEYDGWLVLRWNLFLVTANILCKN